METAQFNRKDAVFLMMALSRIEGFVISENGMKRQEGISKDLSEATELCLKLISRMTKEHADSNLLTAIEETIEDNLELADGDDCTLIKLKRALKAHNKRT